MIDNYSLEVQPVHPVPYNIWEWDNRLDTRALLLIVTRLFLLFSNLFNRIYMIMQALVKPMVRGFKRLIPGSMYNYYNEVLATKRVFKMMSPLRPAISSYAYSKFEQGVFWSLKRSWRFAVDNFIEFEKK